MSLNEELQVDALDYEVDDSKNEVGLEVDALDDISFEDEIGGEVGKEVNAKPVEVFSTSPKVILAAGTIIRPDATIMNITATVGGGAVTLTSNPSIADGINGQILILRGSSATDTVTLQDTSFGMVLNGNCTLALDDTLILYYDGIIQSLIFRFEYLPAGHFYFYLRHIRQQCS